jgi:hypothetical protein
VAANSGASRSGAVYVKNSSGVVSAQLNVNQAAGTSSELPPSVTITSPTSGSTVSGSITIAATATDGDSTPVTKIEMYCDSTLIGTVNSGTYLSSYNTALVANGSHTFVAKAFDSVGSSTVNVTVTVSNSPTSSGGQLQWVKMGQGDWVASACSVAADSSGNVVSVGSFSPHIDFGNGTLTSSYGTGGFLVKYNAQGAALWSKSFASSVWNANNLAQSVAVDSAGNVVVTGFFTGAVDFGGITLTSSANPGASSGYDNNGFVAKYSSSGSLIWAKIMGFGGSTGGRAVAVDGSGNVFVAAAFPGSATFGNISLTSVGSSDIALIKLASGDGTVLWAKRYGGANTDTPNGAAVDRAGDVFLTGTFGAAPDLGGGLRTAAGGNDLFLAKYSGADGSYRWGKTLGSTGNEAAKAVATDPNTGNVVLTGMFGGDMDFGGGLLSPGGIFLAAYDGSGNYRWAKTPNVPSYGFANDCGNAVSIDGAGNIAVTGQATSTIAFDGHTASFGSAYVSQFLASYSSSGSYRWAERAGGKGESAGTGVACGPLGRVIGVGSVNSISTDSTILLGGASLTPSPMVRDPFLAQFSN